MGHDMLRHVEISAPGGTYRLETWDTGRTRRPESQHCLLGYRFTSPRGEVLFEGEEFGCSPCIAIDSDESLRSLLGFLCLQPGDTDAEYFAGYSPAQLEFAEGYDAECIAAVYTCGEDEASFEEVA